MKDASSQALITAAYTLFGAIFLLILSEVFRGLYVGPILSLRAHIGTITDRVIFYIADLTSGAAISAKREREISNELRQLSTQLRAKEQMIPQHSIWAKIHLVPSPMNIDKAAKALIGLSNGFGAIPPEEDAAGPIIPLPVQYKGHYDANFKRILDLQAALGLKVDIVPKIDSLEATRR